MNRKGNIHEICKSTWESLDQSNHRGLFRELRPAGRRPLGASWGRSTEFCLANNLFETPAPDRIVDRESEPTSPDPGATDFGLHLHDVVK